MTIVGGKLDISNVEILNEWDGVVTGIDNDTIYARIKDMTNIENEEEYAEFDIDFFTDEQLAEIEIGSYFKWYIYYEGDGDAISHLIFK